MSELPITNRIGSLRPTFDGVEITAHRDAVNLAQASVPAWRQPVPAWRLPAALPPAGGAPDRGQVPLAEIPPPRAGASAQGFVYAGQLNDLRSGDFPRLQGRPTVPDDWNRNAWLRSEVARQDREPDARLLARLNFELQTAMHGHPLASTLMRHFVGKTGATFTSPPGSAWSNLIRQDPEALRVADTLRARIQGLAETQYARTGRVDLTGMKVPMSLATDRAVWGDKPWSPAWGAFGSTDGTQVELIQARFDPATRRVSGTLRVTLIDTFGVSNQDNDSPGQIAMWLLQHQRGYKPFIHQVQFDVPLDFPVRTSAPPAPGLRPLP